MNCEHEFVRKYSIEFWPPVHVCAKCGKDGTPIIANAEHPTGLTLEELEEYE